MKKITEGDALPEFSLESISGETLTKRDILGNNTLFFIYPKNGTKSCTLEANDFSNLKKSFVELGLRIYGISCDSITSHKKFISKHGLDLELLYDENSNFVTSVGSWVEKSMYGKKYMGIERTTILVNKEGRVIKLWRKVRVPEHALNVLAFAKKELK
tara:strand:- start:855 stop:1328 length:474 start_codon:yes stop_codon:yes gene_type:complete